MDAQRDVTYEEASAFAEENGLTFIECSAKTCVIFFLNKKYSFLEETMLKTHFWKRHDEYIRIFRMEGIK